MAGQRLGVDHVLLDGARVGKAHPDLRVFKLRPQNARRVQKQKPLIDRDPLLAARNAGAVLGLCALAPGDLVDERRFSHIRNADDHELQGPSHLSLLRVPRQLFSQQRAHRRDEAGNALFRLAVGLQNGIALRPEVLCPFFRQRRVCHVDAVQDDHARLIAADRVDIRVAAGNRDARVENFAHGVDELHILLDHPARLGHVAGVPLDIHGALVRVFLLHDTAPNLCQLCPPVTAPNSFVCRPGKTTSRTFPKTASFFTQPTSENRLSSE